MDIVPAFRFRMAEIWNYPGLKFGHGKTFLRQDDYFALIPKKLDDGGVSWRLGINPKVDLGPNSPVKPLIKLLKVG